MTTVSILLPDTGSMGFVLGFLSIAVTFRLVILVIRLLRG